MVMIYRLSWNGSDVSDSMGFAFILGEEVKSHRPNCCGKTFNFDRAHYSLYFSLSFTFHLFLPLIVGLFPSLRKALVCSVPLFFFPSRSLPFSALKCLNCGKQSNMESCTCSLLPKHREHRQINRMEITYLQHKVAHMSHNLFTVASLVRRASSSFGFCFVHWAVLMFKLCLFSSFVRSGSHLRKVKFSFSMCVCSLFVSVFVLAKVMSSANDVVQNERLVLFSAHLPTTTHTGLSHTPMIICLINFAFHSKKERRRKKPHNEHTTTAVAKRV